MNKQIYKILSIILIIASVVSNISKMPIVVNAAETEYKLAENEKYTMELGGTQRFKIVPEKNGIACIQINSIFDSSPTVTLYDEQNNVLLNYDRQFTYDLEYSVQAGDVYYLETSSKGGDESGYSVYYTVQKTAENIYFKNPVEIRYIGISGYSYLDLSVEPVDGVIGTITWTCEDNDIIDIIPTFEKSVSFNCLKVGTTTITATTQDGMTASAEVIIKEPEEIIPDVEKMVDVTLPGHTYIYEYIPNTTDTYYFYPTKGENIHLTIGRDWGYGLELCAGTTIYGQTMTSYKLEGGRKYYFTVSCPDTYTGQVSVMLSTSYTEENTEKTTINEEESTTDVENVTTQIESISDEKSTMTTSHKTEEINSTQTVNSIADTTNTKKSSIKKLVAKKKSIKVIWRKKSGISGYQLQYSTSKNFKKAKKITIKKAKTTTKTIKKLKAKKKYYIRIRTYITIDGKKIWSKWSKAKVKKTK